MSKIHSTLHATPGQKPAVRLAPSEPAVEEEMSFIEIGPKRVVVDASPGVLAAHPPAPEAAPLPRPHGVQFRTLPDEPATRLAAELVAYHAPDQPAAKQYAELLNVLLEAARRRTGARQALLFSGVRAGAGCTTVLLNLAISAARGGHKVVVVDANLRRPGVAGKLALDDAPGLAEVLAGEPISGDPLRQTAVENLTALTAGTPAPVLGDVGMLRSLTEELRQAFDLVLIDGPRWDGRVGCQALAGMCDAVFLVVPACEADGPPASELLRELPGQGVALAGCVLTEP